MIALEDLKNMTEQEVIEHLAYEYSGEQRYDTPRKEIVLAAKEMLGLHKVIIAYESVGSWGCDSSSYFLLQHKTTGELFEIHGSHCSCYGFEGQLSLEQTDIATLKHRIKNGGNIFYCGGYDDNATENYKIVNGFIESLNL